MSDGVWALAEGDGVPRGTPTCQHALVHDAGSLDERGVAGHDHPVGRDDDDVAGHEVRGHGLADVWGQGQEDTALQHQTKAVYSSHRRGKARLLFCLLLCVISWDLPLSPRHTDTRTTLCAATMSCSMTNC